MQIKHKYNIIILLALLGLGVSLYLTVNHYLNKLVPCTVTHGCEVVLSSKYSVVLGMPLPVWGSLYFVTVIVSALLARSRDLWQKFLAVLVAAGALVSLVLLYIQFFVLQKICQYCLTVDITNLIIFLFELNTAVPGGDFIKTPNPL